VKRSPIRRGRPLPRATKPLDRTTRVKATNPRRQAENFARAYGGDARVAWVQALPCTLGCAGPCENAHVKTGGAGRKADARWIVPLCRSHHAEIHQHGQRSFEARHEIDLAFCASIIDARWEAYRAAAPDTLKARPK
jgi:hypothetical protein